MGLFVFERHFGYTYSYMYTVQYTFHFRQNMYSKKEGNKNIYKNMYTIPRNDPGKKLNPWKTVPRWLLLTTNFSKSFNV